MSSVHSLDPVSLEEMIKTIVSQYIAQVGDSLVEEYANKAAARIQTEIRTAVAKTAIELTRFISFQSMGQELIITLKDYRGENL